MIGAAAVFLPDGRLHLQHGPIDLIVQAWGPGAGAGYARAQARFAGLLEELVAELPALRSCRAQGLHGPVARAMAAAVARMDADFITPMAAVAGAVADAVLAALAGDGISRAYVNNGGDIALCLTSGESLTAAIAGGRGARVLIGHDDPVRGIATSGWRGRSFSFGIADAVTVLAGTAAAADAAATVIANAVDLPGHAAIARRPACEVQADSDLGARRVTVAVGPLTPGEVSRALDRGAAVARRLMAAKHIAGAALFLQSDMRTLGPHCLLALTPEPCLG